MGEKPRTFYNNIPLLIHVSNCIAANVLVATCLLGTFYQTVLTFFRSDLIIYFIICSYFSLKETPFLCSASYLIGLTWGHFSDCDD